MRLRLRLAATIWIAACGVARADKVDVQQFHPAATSTGYLSLDEPSVRVAGSVRVSRRTSGTAIART